MKMSRTTVWRLRSFFHRADTDRHSSHFRTFGSTSSGTGPLSTQPPRHSLPRFCPAGRSISKAIRPPPLPPEDMERLQQLLAERGHNVGPIDGILGAMTRAAVQDEQVKRGLPADAWPTVELLELLK